MHLYLIRHGQTELGKRFHFQRPETPLSNKGRAQALAVKASLENVPFTKVYTSTFARAQETAGYIASGHGVVPELHEFFEEKFNLSSSYGRSYFSLDFAKLAYATLLGLMLPRYHIGDEETMHELMKRAQFAKGFLERHADEYVVVVSHSLFISAFLDAIFAHSRIPVFVRVIHIVIRSIFIKNTQVFYLHYDTKEGWKKIG